MKYSNPTQGPSSSSSPSVTIWSQNDVFLSFRGEDTRHSFTDHLHSNLLRKGIKTFIDDELERGEQISQALLKEIEGSRISIIVFSKNYASSRWCLDELLHILHCKESKQQLVFPVFYKVDPSDVRHQRGTFGEAIATHKRNFKDDMNKVLRWVAALEQAANLSGWHFSGRHESKFIENIVEDISVRMLHGTDFHVTDHPVGIESRVRDICNLLCVGENDVRMVGIWGIGGIGKTTIARAVYNSISHRFEASCFLENVREESMQHGGLVKLQNILLSKIVGGKELEVTNAHEGINVIKKRLGTKRVLLIVDDVSQLEQLQKLVVAPEWFFSGSRVIITSRDKHLFNVHQVNLIYKVNELDDDEAFDLCTAIAFPGKIELSKDYVMLARTVVQYARGLPLVLVVLGLALNGGNMERMQRALKVYKEVPNPKIHDTLKISFNSLEDPAVKEVFLDIACFFKGESKDHVIHILEGCDLNPKTAIDVLEENALINIKEGNFIWMHDLLEEMGKEIVRQESPDKPGKRSRLWSHEDVSLVLREGKGTNKIKAIMLNLPTPDEIRLSALGFSKMTNLKLFINRNAHLSGDIGFLTNELRFIDWPEFPSEHLPFNSNPKKLLKLNMPRSRMSQLGVGFKSLKNLKSINLESCRFLTKFPDASGFPNLKYLNLSYCSSLVEVHHSVGFLDKLVALSLEGCDNLTSFPKRIALKSVKDMNLRGCITVNCFPEIVEKMECLTVLDLSGTAIRDLPSSIGYLVSLEVLTLEGCENLESLPQSIYEMQHLRNINLSGCIKFVKFPKWTAESFPNNSNISPDLWYLNLRGCQRLEEIPELPPKVEWVNAANCASLNQFAKLSNILEHKESEMIECINLLNCPELRLCYKLVEEESLCSLLFSSKQSEFDVVFPGREVPEWFNFCQNLPDLTNKSEFSFEIPRHFKVEKRGLAISAAVEINMEGKEYMRTKSVVQTKQKEKEIASTSSNFGRCCFAARIYINEENVASRSFYFEGKDMESAHVWLLYIPFLSFAHCPLPPFTCRVSLEHTSQDLVVCKSYGVHLGFEYFLLSDCSTVFETPAPNVAITANVLLDEASLCSLFPTYQYQFKVILPGSEVPWWFTYPTNPYESIKSKFSLEIPPNFQVKNRGLALCAAVELSQKGKDTEENIGDSLFVIEMNSTTKLVVSFRPSAKEIESAHVFLCYIPFVKLAAANSGLMPLTCQVTFRHSHEDLLCSKSFGAHLVKPQDEDFKDEDEGRPKDQNGISAVWKTMKTWWMSE